MSERMSWEEQEKRIEERIKLQDEQLRAYLAMAKALECVVCSKHGQRVVLLGGFGIALCNVHLNTWHEFLHSHELCGQYNDAQAEFYVSLYQRSEEVAKACNRAWQEVADAMYELSGEWLKEEKMKWQEH